MTKHLKIDEDDPLYKAWRARGYDENKTGYENMKILWKNVSEDFAQIERIYQLIQQNLALLMRAR